MTEKEEDVQKEDQFANSPLGKDPESSQDTPSQKKEEESSEGSEGKEEGGEDKEIVLSQEDYAKLLESADAYKLIVSDPQLSQQIMDHFRKKTSRVPSETPKQQQGSDTSDDADELPPKVKKILEENEQLKRASLATQQAIAELQVSLFREKHPDMDEYRKTMGELIQKHNMTLEQAYEYAKLAKQQKAGSPSSPPPETVSRGKVSSKDVESSDLADIEKKILDRKAAPRLDDALRIAIDAAYKQHSK